MLQNSKNMLSHWNTNLTGSADLRNDDRVTKNMVIEEKVPELAANKVSPTTLTHKAGKNNFSLRKIRRKAIQKTRRPLPRESEKLATNAHSQFSSSRASSKSSFRSDSANHSYFSNNNSDLQNVSISIKITSLSSDEEESKAANKN